METITRTSSRTVRGALVAALALTAWLALGDVAHAACHAFTVEASPSTADEGSTVTVTIRRDAAVEPSSVRVRTVDETATGSSDYTPLDERVEFTSGTEQQRQIDILDDQSAEQTETFRIELSEGQGCNVNPNFTYDSTTVSISDDDPATTTDGDGGGEPTSEPTTAADVDDMPQTGTGSTLVLSGLALLAVVGILVRARTA